MFSDYFLLRHLIGIDKQTLEKYARQYLETLQLNKKVGIRDGAFSTVDLSFGQRKRLSLLAACLEDRPVYVFDEWAAGQDTAFKKIFYEEILADLKTEQTGSGHHPRRHLFPGCRPADNLEDGRIRQR